ncbi:uncharacterized protein B0H18DRAFT_1213426 [Fomitopsis serialis]|uniref:uncharacterized protein n=1 Tax=Fomitopsis serialis TaxID=139415 RepID=UPI0020085703|nr:uncharacterized protein B0H18DRAFT_157835 [Neoantrodia serialis]XP_047890079.1 uncharacterized protein B0H18DRAFT_1213426 [Neoantrodia serialis]KAH9913748.1 hypothetical protein B0H18DRAFT_157835 [Neoantrodia serialis]KAH9920296.1 hypothetical protein B0H18DRAFT_1213426 [Neoantrodia serialis]
MEGTARRRTRRGGRLNDEYEERDDHSKGAHNSFSLVLPVRPCDPAYRRTVNSSRLLATGQCACSSGYPQPFDGLLTRSPAFTHSLALPIYLLACPFLTHMDAFLPAALFALPPASSFD